MICFQQRKILKILIMSKYDKKIFEEINQNKFVELR